VNKTGTNQDDNKKLAAKLRLGNVRDELELYGWRAGDVERYMRDAWDVLAPEEVVELFEELLAEERAYYRLHAPLNDDQLDHTDVTA
jgi:hypothetical protein